MKAISDLKRELVKYGEKIYEEGLVIDAGGNISAKLGRAIYLKASGVSLKESMGCDYVEIDIASGKELGSPCRPSSIELPMHLACYSARSDIGAVVHTHPVYGNVAASMGGKVGLISYELLVAMRREIPVIKYITPGSKLLAQAVGKAIAGHNGVLLENHGALVVGKDIKEAFFRALALERACKTLVFTKLTGNIKLIPDSDIRNIK
jgi:L-fuculose-phosphate aldolase